MAGVAYAVVRSDPPDVFVADDVDVLSRLLALELVARTDPRRVDPVVASTLRTALLEERWDDALADWIELTSTEVDVYPCLQVCTVTDLPSELIGAQLQFAPLFRHG